jgi:hypothetical protein
LGRPAAHLRRAQVICPSGPPERFQGARTPSKRLKSHLNIFNARLWLFEALLPPKAYYLWSKMVQKMEFLGQKSHFLGPKGDDKCPKPTQRPAKHYDKTFYGFF